MPLLRPWTDHVHLELWATALIGVHADHEQLTIGHLDPKLSSVGAHDGRAHRVTANRRESLGDATQILERHRVRGWACHWRCSARKAAMASSES
jgi:hypothetical protein